MTLAPTGLLQELAGRTGKGALRFVLRRATFDQGPTAERFAVPAAATEAGAGTDAARAQRQGVEATFRQSEAPLLRSRLWRAWAAVKQGTVDSAAELAARVVLAPILAPRVDEMVRAVAGPTEEMVAQLVAQAGTDRRPENVAELRAKGADTVDAGL